MKYLIRAVKYFFYFSFLCALILTALVLTGLAEGDINSLFRHGSEDIVRIAVLFLAIAAIYPKVGFITRSCRLEGGLKANETGISAFMRERSYKLESSGADKLTYRRAGGASRFFRMMEDRITLTESEGEVLVEGLRKDVVRLTMGLENRFGPQQPQEN